MPLNMIDIPTQYIYLVRGTSNVVSLDPADGKVYSIQHDVIKFEVCQWLAAGQWSSPCTLCTSVSSTNKTDRHNITEILLKVALNTITMILEGHKHSL